ISSDSASIVVTACPGIDEKETMVLKVYPNPFSNNIVVEIEQLGNEQFEAELFDLSGRNISIEIIRGATKLTLQLKENIAPGSYLLRLSSERYVKSVKMVKVE